MQDFGKRTDGLKVRDDNCHETSDLTTIASI